MTGDKKNSAKIQTLSYTSLLEEIASLKDRVQKLESRLRLEQADVRYYRRASDRHEDRDGGFGLS